MASIKFDDTEILDADHIPQYIKHESVAERVLVSMSLGREDGEAFISERYGKKLITLRGMLRGSSQADLDDAIDEFKELFSRPEKALDVSFGSGTRRYIATCTKHEFDRDHYHTNGVPWTAEFVVSGGVGYDTEVTTPISADSITTADDGDGNYVHEGSFDIEGSKAAAPIITLEFTTADADMLGIEFMNTDTGERIVITRNGDWNGATLIIDCLNKRVLDNVLNGGDPVEGSFYGMFPNFQIGTNNFRITTGGIVSQRSSEDSVPANGAPGYYVRFLNDSKFCAMSFTVPYTDDTYGAVKLGLTHEGSPPASTPFAYIWPDDEGEPDSGAALTSDSFDGSAVPTYPTYAYVTASLPTATLQANTRYWLGMTISLDDPPNYFDWNGSSDISYPRGGIKTSIDSGGTWSDEIGSMAFRILFGGAPKETDFNLTVEYTKTYL